MWFKNLVPYRLSDDLVLSAAAIEPQLSAYGFTPCAAHDSKALGWVPPFALADGPLLQCHHGQWLLCARQEEKLLPAAVINQVLQQRLEQWQHSTGTSLNRAKKQAVREQIISTLLPRAFSTFQETRVWIDPANRLLVVDSASVNRAETILALLRKSLGTLPVLPWLQAASTTPLLTRWVATQSLPEGFLLQEEAELRTLQVGGSVIRCKYQPLDSEEIAGHLAANKVVTQLALTWQQHIQFVLTEEGLFKRLKYADSLLQQHSDYDQAEALQRSEADFLLATGALSALLKNLEQPLSESQLPTDNPPNSPSSQHT